ncbi:hypothetical protein [Bradyrhizobium sp.]|uniref:hypothetical protein n=1 Tax=Bradyrhizobium sp. TaxID=376 RepID=UPI001ECE0AEA|nr:hypothetical protein [Bradyrhizobium sp.]MBV9984584.1 hypothetical protein [Bradyrhizobium sp.]
MLKRTISGTAIALALAMTAPAPTAAQEVVSEPGNCAFFYPYANCQNKGPGNPDTDPYFRRGLIVSPAPWSMATAAGVASRRARYFQSEVMRRWQ